MSLTFDADDVFGEHEGFKPFVDLTKASAIQQESPKDKNIKDMNFDSNSNQEFEYTNTPPQIIGSATLPEHFSTLLKRIKTQYSNLPSLRYSDIYKELSQLTVKTVSTPTLQTINRELEKAQAAKDRISEIEMQVNQCLMLKERIVDILMESWAQFTDGKSADVRKGDAAFRFANFQIDLAMTESLSKGCKMIMQNLCSLQDTLSRKITSIQLQIKLMDLGRTALPDFQFSDSYVGLDKVDQALKENIDQTTGITPEMSSF